MHSGSAFQRGIPFAVALPSMGCDEGGLRSKGHKAWAWTLSGLSSGASCLCTLAVSSCGQLVWGTALPTVEKGNHWCHRKLFQI